MNQWLTKILIFHPQRQLKDFIFHTSKIDLNSLQRSPSWTDGFVVGQYATIITCDVYDL